MSPVASATVATTSGFIPRRRTGRDRIERTSTSTVAVSSSASVATVRASPVSRGRWKRRSPTVCSPSDSAASAAFGPPGTSSASRSRSGCGRRTVMSSSGSGLAKCVGIYSAAMSHHHGGGAPGVTSSSTPGGTSARISSSSSGGVLPGDDGDELRAVGDGGDGRGELAAGGDGRRPHAGDRVEQRGGVLLRRTCGVERQRRDQRGLRRGDDGHRAAVEGRDLRDRLDAERGESDSKPVRARRPSSAGACR